MVACPIHDSNFPSDSKGAYVNRLVSYSLAVVRLFPFTPPVCSDWHTKTLLATSWREALVFGESPARVFLSSTMQPCKLATPRYFQLDKVPSIKESGGAGGGELSDSLGLNNRRDGKGRLNEFHTADWSGSHSARSIVLSGWNSHLDDVLIRTESHAFQLLASLMLGVGCC